MSWHAERVFAPSMRRLWPVVLAALLAAPAPAVARIRVVDLRTGAVRTIATLGGGEVDDLLVSGRRAAVYQR